MLEHNRIGIITINWNGIEDTIECVNSLLRLSENTFHIYVVDNNSDNDEAMKLIETFKAISKVTIIRNKNNDGYAEGNNVGIRRAIADGWTDYFWLVNNDAIVDPNALTELLAVAEANSHIGIVGSTIMYPDKKTVYALGGGSINMWTGIDRLYGARRRYQADHPPQRFNYISGASFFIRRNVFDALNGFDADYFLYSEEADFCLQAVKHGYRLGYAPRSFVYHKSAQSTKHLSPTYIYYFIRNKILLMHKRAHWWNRPSWLFTVFAYYGLGCCFKLVLHWRWRDISNVYEAFRDGMSQRWGNRLPIISR